MANAIRLYTRIFPNWPGGSNGVSARPGIHAAVVRNNRLFRDAFRAKAGFRYLFDHGIKGADRAAL